MCLKHGRIVTVITYYHTPDDMNVLILIIAHKVVIFFCFQCLPTRGACLHSLRMAAIREWKLRKVNVAFIILFRIS